MASDISPMMRQYRQIKAQNPQALLFFRAGDFYEMFFEDAVTAARELSITLTSRNRNDENPVPMCGMPYHAAEQYMARLVRKGFRVAVCEQVEDPKMAKGLVKREVVRVLTPGTATLEGVLEGSENNFLLAIHQGSAVGAVFLDLSTGDFLAFEADGENALSSLRDQMAAFPPREILVAENRPNRELEELARQIGSSPLFTEVPEWAFEMDHAKRLLREQFHISSLEGVRLESRRAATRAAGAIIHYLKETQKSGLDHIVSIQVLSERDHLVVDATTLRNLEVLELLADGSKRHSLLGLLDFTHTAMGGRMLRQWVVQPLRSMEAIQERLDAVEELSVSHLLRADLRDDFRRVQDVERLLARITLGSANARDLLSLRTSLDMIPVIRQRLAETSSERLLHLRKDLDELPALRTLIEKAIQDDPPVGLREGKLIRTGYSAELDSLRDLAAGGKSAIAKMEQQERDRSGISTLKIRYNKVFGYYIEVAKARAGEVPSDYTRKQTLVNAERYITPDLKHYEEEVLSAESRIADLEYELFTKLRDAVSLEAVHIRKVASLLADLDCLASLAEAATRRRYCRPSMNNSSRLRIRAGRHPMVEVLNTEGRFVSNDTEMDPEESQIHLITGPNMGGKSTYIRQLALITLMAHIGSFVPADEAEIGLVDRIFARVGASDNIAFGLSTFMVEMVEMARILNAATSQSLVVLDEIGRGTSTFDGLSLAWAVVEYLHDTAGCMPKTLFATHYHELTDLAFTLDRVRNFHITVREWSDEIVFLHGVEEGRSDRSYGIQVARLAGLPPPVIRRAREILTNLESEEYDQAGTPRIAKSRDLLEQHFEPGQLELFYGADHPILTRLSKVDPDTLTPREALKLLYELKSNLNSPS